MRAIIQLAHLPCDATALADVLLDVFPAALPTDSIVHRSVQLRQLPQPERAALASTVVHACTLPDGHVAFFFAYAQGLLECDVERGYPSPRAQSVSEQVVGVTLRALRKAKLRPHLLRVDMEESSGGSTGIVGVPSGFIRYLINRGGRNNAAGNLVLLATVGVVGWFVVGLWTLALSPVTAIVALVAEASVYKLGHHDAVSWENRS